MILGQRRGPFTVCLHADVLQAYAPVAIVTQIFEAQNEGRVALASEEERSATGGMHGEHDVVLHRPIVAGEPLQIWVEGHGARTAGRNALVTLRYVAVDDADAVVAEQWWTTVFLGTACETVGEPPPDHAFPEEARARSLGSWEVDVDEAMARRYAEVSGDWSPHHFDVEGARRSGFERPFLHGLCTMALCGRAVVEQVADGDADRVRRLAVRFASPAFLGDRLRVDLYDAGPLGVAFEAECGGTTVVTHGRAELG